MSSRKEKVAEREELRGYLRQGIMESIEAGNYEQAKHWNTMLNDASLKKRAFDELNTYTEYTDALKWGAEKSTGEAYTGDINDLIEDDFEKWNLLTNNITAGAGGLAYAATLSPEEKKNQLLRFTVFDDTDAMGDGSRNLWEQTKDVAGAIATDPVTWTGLGNIPKIAGKLGQSALIKKAFGEGAEAMASASLVGGALSAGNDLNTQLQRQQLGGKPVDPVQVATAGAFGGVGGVAGQVVGKAVGPIARGIRHPIEAIKSGGARVMTTKGRMPKMATQEAHNIGKDALDAMAKTEAKAMAEGMKKGELFNFNKYNATSKVEPNSAKKKLAELLISDKKYVAELIQNPKSIESLKSYFPQQTASINNITKLMKGLQKTEGVSSNNIGKNLIKDLLVDSVSGIPGSSKAIRKMSPAKIIAEGTKQSWFTNALLHAFNKRGGRLNGTFMNSVKRKYKLSDAQTAEFQDYMWGLMANVPAQAVYREKSKDFKEKGQMINY